MSSPTITPKSSRPRPTRELYELGVSRCAVGGRRKSGRRWIRQATARTAVGPTVRGEFERAGLRGRNGLESWPVSPKSDGLQLIEALLRSADGTVSLTIHPRCRNLIQAFGSYARAKSGTQWLDHPLDPQHPWEDLIDPLCGGLKLEFPEGRRPPLALRRSTRRGCMLSAQS